MEPGDYEIRKLSQQKLEAILNKIKSTNGLPAEVEAELRDANETGRLRIRFINGKFDVKIADHERAVFIVAILGLVVIGFVWLVVLGIVKLFGVSQLKACSLMALLLVSGLRSASDVSTIRDEVDGLPMVHRLVAIMIVVVEVAGAMWMLTRFV